MTESERYLRDRYGDNYYIVSMNDEIVRLRHDGLILSMGREFYEERCKDGYYEQRTFNDSV